MSTQVSSVIVVRLVELDRFAEVVAAAGDAPRCSSAVRRRVRKGERRSRTVGWLPSRYVTPSTTHS
ncbi:hypothetical protein GTA07_12670, partial [Rhodococcus hoagii]|nr:hypothetical protein [Prescottella equi]